MLKPWVDIWKGYSYRTIYLVNFNICIGVGSVRNDAKTLLVLDTDSAADLHPPGDAYISQMLFHCGPHFSDSGSQYIDHASLHPTRDPSALAIVTKMLGL